MRYQIVHGPSRVSAALKRDGSVTSLEFAPCHQIIGRGLLRAAERHNLVSPEWQEVSALVDRGLAGGPIPGDPRLERWLELARSNRVLAYEDSASCAMEFVSQNAAELCRTITGDARDANSISCCELWSIKEGHTSSVWVVTLHTDPDESSIRFVVNVARDVDAGRELLAMGSELAMLASRDSSAVVGVLACSTVSHGWEVPVVATNWIPDSCELHVLSDGQAVAVDHFNSAMAEPNRVASIAVRRGLASDDLWSAILRSWIALGDWSCREGPVLLPETEINEGDWVLANGKAILCALTPGELQLSLRDAVTACLSLCARFGNCGRQIPWGNQHRALEVLREAAASNPSLGAVLLGA